MSGKLGTPSGKVWVLAIVAGAEHGVGEAMRTFHAQGPLGRRGWRVLALAVFLAGHWGLPSFAADLRFQKEADGGFSFDTGEWRGRLRSGGKSMGLQEVVQVHTGARLDRSNGLLSHYRVFSAGRRYGGGAWDWPSTAELSGAGETVEVHWPERPDRPFEMWATYRWLDARSVELETRVRAAADLPGFESFVASYFSESFTNAAVALPPRKGGAEGRWTAATRDRGDWQIFPRDTAAVPLIGDGRWKLEPNPVAWVVREPFGTLAAGLRRSASLGIWAVFRARSEDCFAMAMPEQSEGHRSLYFSLFGRDLKAGQSATARVRLALVGDEAEAWRRATAE